MQPHKMLLARSRRVLALFLGSLLITAALVVWLMRLRQGFFEFESVPIFYALFLFHDYPAALVMLVAIVGGLLPALRRTGLRIAVWIGENPWSTASIALVVLAGGARVVYHAHPLAMDEYAPVFQSQIFAAGRLTGDFPPELMDWLVPESFQQYFLHVSHDSGAVASSYWPGFAILLTPFTLLGVPWLANPVLAAAALFAVHRLGASLYQSSTAAGVVVLFTVGSAAFTVNAISFYSMTAHLLCNALFALLLLNATPFRCFLAGLIGGLALVLHNPVPHALFALPWIFWLAISPGRWARLGALTAGYLPAVLLLGIGWAALLGDIAQSTTGVQDLTVSGVAQEIERRLHELLRVPTADLLSARGIGLAKVWLWAAPALILLACAGLWRHRRQTPVLLLAASLAVTFIGYLFVPFDQGHGWGFRYLQSAWLAIPLLAVGAFDWTRAEVNRDECLEYAAGAAVLGLLILTPLRAYQVDAFITRHLAQMPSAKSGVAEVIIVNPVAGYYAVDLVQNDPFLRNRPIVLVTRGKTDDSRMIAGRFPGATVLNRSFRGTVIGQQADSTAVTN